MNLDGRLLNEQEPCDLAVLESLDEEVINLSLSRRQQFSMVPRCVWRMTEELGKVLITSSSDQANQVIPSG